MSEVRVAVARGELRCYLARPAGQGPRPGGLVLHDAIGMTPDLRAQADWPGPGLRRCRGVPVGTILRQSCPVVASYGAEDRTLRGAATRLSGALEAGGADYDIKEYPGAGHSFMNNHPSTLAVLRGAAGPDAALPRVFAIFNAVVGRPLMKTRYAEPQAADARGRIIDFFDRHLASAQDSARVSPGESG